MFFHQHNSQSAIAGKFVERSGDAAARGSRIQRIPGAGSLYQSFDQRENGARVGAKISLKVEFAARQKDGDAVIADGTGEQNFVARTNRPRIDHSTDAEAAQFRWS